MACWVVYADAVSVDHSAATLPFGLTTSQPGDDARAGLPVGEVFAGRYEVDRVLGHGGMGIVYRAKDRLVDDWVAIKLLNFGGTLPPEAIDMFRREVRVARRITHPNVVRIHDLDDYFGRLFISMEYVDGWDLRRTILDAGGPLAEATAVLIARKIAEALEAAHDVDVIHRDLKPENVLVDKSGRLVLSDFGIASVLDRSSSELKGSSEASGTPTYMAPEQVAGLPTGPAVDIYAFGTLLYEMLAGRAPFPGDDGMTVALARLTKRAPPLRSLVQCSETLATLVMECLATRPEDRPSSMKEVGRRLDDIKADANTSSVQPILRENGRTTKAPVSPEVAKAAARRSLACLRFTYRGAAEHDYLGEALSGELIDMLSRTKGLRVLGSGAVQKLGDTRDPREISQALGVDYIVDGGVQVIGDKIRVSVRVLEASGTQLTSQRFDMGMADLFELQDRAAHLIAEALRLDITTHSMGRDVPEAAIEKYLRARTILRAQAFHEVGEACDLLEKAIALCPSFEPAIAAYAIAAVQTSFFPHGAADRDWGAVARIAVDDAQRISPDLPETHVATARIASHEGRLRDAVIATKRALALAPTSADANNLFGQLQCETGHVEEGLARLALAYQIEPTAPAYFYEMARHASYLHDEATFERAVSNVASISATWIGLHLRLRAAAWWGSRERLLAVRDDAPSAGPPLDSLFEAVASAYLGELPPAVAAAAMKPVLARVNMRFGSLLRQILVEVYASAGDISGALEWLGEAHASLLYDIVWLERCPLLEPLRGAPAFEEILRAVRASARQVWAG